MMSVLDWSIGANRRFVRPIFVRENEQKMSAALKGCVRGRDANANLQNARVRWPRSIARKKKKQR
ncbi:hypothetical protein P3T18_003585 [Paraburkholderia sp. GAS199]|uniref:hypothetical protein n=1 Tax=Paraburkholderia sp. GAS199 TaxID=3035126 RepID=UPI003D237ACE